MSGETHHSAASETQNVAQTVDMEAVRQALEHGPRGALIVAGTTLSMLLLGWLAFYFLLFLPRGGVS